MIARMTAGAFAGWSMAAINGHHVLLAGCLISSALGMMKDWAK